MPPVPKHIVTKAVRYALGEVRHSSASPDTPNTIGITQRDLDKVCVVVIGDDAAKWRRVFLLPVVDAKGDPQDASKAWGDETKTQNAVKKATELATQAWLNYTSNNALPTPTPGGQALPPTWSTRPNVNTRAPRAAIGVVTADTNGIPVPHDAAAEKARNKRKEVRPPSFRGPAESGYEPEYDPMVAAAATDDAETMFEQYRGAIVWIDDQGVNETVYDFNGVRTWEIGIARTRAAGALAAGAGSEPYGGKVLFNGTHGAVGVYSQASSGSSSAGPIVEFVQDEYEANA